MTPCAGIFSIAQSYTKRSGMLNMQQCQQDLSCPSKDIRGKLDQNTLFKNQFIVLIRLRGQTWGFSYTSVEKQLKHRPVKLNRYRSDKLNCCSWPACVQQSGAMGPAKHAQLNQTCVNPA